MCLRVYVLVCVLCMYLRVYVFACVYLHMHLYTCVCVYVFVCMYLLPLVAAEPHGWILDPVTKAGVNLPALIMKIYNACLSILKI